MRCKMKKIKNLLVVSLLCILFIVSFAFVACTDESTEQLPQSTVQGDLEYTVSDGFYPDYTPGYRVSAANKDISGSLTIPATYNGKPVLWIDESGFATTNLTNVVIQDGVKEIWNYAFTGCTSLTSITIPASVTKISNYAFGSSNNLTITFLGTRKQWNDIKTEFKHTLYYKTLICSDDN